MKEKNKTNCKVYVVLFAIFLITGNQYKVLSQDVIIADHNAVGQYDQIPQEWIDEVKKMLLCIPGESHGTGYIYGLQLLDTLDSKYAVNATWSGEPEAYTDQHLRVVRTYWTGSNWSGSGGEEDFWTNDDAITMMTNNLDYMRNTLGNPVDAFGFGWCWDMTWQNAATEEKDPVYGCGWAGSTSGGPEGSLPWGLDDEDSVITGNSVNLQNYLNAVVAYNENHSQTKTFYTTGPVDTEAWSERGFQRDIKHQVIRQYVNSNGGVLFDYADILTHNNAGEKYEYGGWEGHSVDYIHLENGGNYDGANGGCHIAEEGCLKLGKAMWWMMARIAGWDGGDVPVDEIENDHKNIKIYPTISHNYFTIEFHSQPYELYEMRIIDVCGQLQEIANIGQKARFGQKLLPGMYYIILYKPGYNDIVIYSKIIKL